MVQGRVQRGWGKKRNKRINKRGSHKIESTKTLGYCHWLIFAVVSLTKSALDNFERRYQIYFTSLTCWPTHPEFIGQQFQNLSPDIRSISPNWRLAKKIEQPTKIACFWKLKGDSKTWFSWCPNNISHELPTFQFT